MHDQRAVRGVHRQRDVGHEAQALGQPQPAFARGVQQRPAVDALHRDVGDARRAHAGVDQARDVRVAELGEDCLLAAEASLRGGRKQSAAQ